MARINDLHFAWRFALYERITDHLVWTTADGAVINGLANGAITTDTDTGIHALGIHASTILGAVGAQGTLWSAALGQRITKEAW